MWIWPLLTVPTASSVVQATVISNLDYSNSPSMIFQLHLWPLHSFLCIAARMVLLNHQANHILTPLFRTLHWFLTLLRLKVHILAGVHRAPPGHTFYFWLPVRPHLLLPRPYYTNPVVVLRHASCAPPLAPFKVPFLLAGMIYPPKNLWRLLPSYVSSQCHFSRRSSSTILWTTGGLLCHTLSLFSASCLSVAFIT